MDINIAIIGCGVIGTRRALHAAPATIRVCVDPIPSKAMNLAQQVGVACEFETDWTKVIADPTLQAVVVATPHVDLPTITLAAISAGKHVLVEKPAARFAEELLPLMRAATAKNVCVRVGFNHRYHRAFRKARELIDDHQLGELLCVRARYGHGGRLGYETEWRADPALSGGGELIDQGVHLIDLARWFLGEFEDITGSAHTYFWNMPVEDNAFLLLKTPKKQVAWLHASCTEWKNTFSFELYGKKGKLEINGLGGSYGVERLTFYQLSAEMGPPQTQIWEYPMQDDSWAIEFQTFLKDIVEKRACEPGLWDAHQALKIVETIGRSSGYDYYP